MIHLVRHGESTWNRDRRLQGQTMAPPLTATGRRQAASARALLAEVDVIVSSDLIRARQTAEILADGGPVTLDERLRERHAGRLQGLPSDAAMGALTDFDWTDPDARLGGGESLREVHARVGAVLTEYRDRAAVLVSHGDTIRAALGWWCGYEPATEPWVDTPSAAVFALPEPGVYRLIAGTVPPA